MNELWQGQPTPGDFGTGYRLAIGGRGVGEHSEMAQGAWVVDGKLMSTKTALCVGGVCGVKN